MKISAIQNNAKKLSENNGWKNNESRERIFRLSGEIGELAEEVINIDSHTRGKDSQDRSIAFEIYDVVWNLCELANQLDINLEPYFAEKHNINNTRSWKK